MSFQFFTINILNSPLFSIKEKEALAFRSEANIKNKPIDAKALSQISYHFFHENLKGVLIQLDIEVVTSEIKFVFNFIGCNHCIQQISLEQSNEIIEMQSILDNQVEFSFLKDQLNHTFRFNAQLTDISEKENILLLEINI